MTSPVIWQTAPLSDYQTETGGVGQTIKLPLGAIIEGDTVRYPVVNPEYSPSPLSVDREEYKYLPHDGGPHRSAHSVQVFSPTRFVSLTDGAYLDLRDTLAISSGATIMDLEFSVSPGVVFPLVGIIGTAYIDGVTARSDGVLAIM